MAVDHPEESRPRRSLDVSHWDQTSWEDFFHPDWVEDAPPQVGGSAIHRANLRRLQAATARQRLRRPMALIRQTTRVGSGGGIIMGTVLLIATAYMLGKVTGLLSHY